ncbi:MAG: response regulator [Gammaproteobacteria bacterium]|nr:response regulator [Gammaproteobacteria bacterium]MCW8988597.1 response regulator [Gammaproteobacteria bacterium]MCW9030267.1 response regulator [Gammaproteobacteria bacterium]
MPADSPKHILVVDDDDMLRSYVKELLKVNNFIVSEAADGKEGLKVFRDNTPDLVITDIIMPEMEGISFIRKLREFSAETPIIAMTGNVHGHMDEYLEISSQIGANEILRKPIKSQEFLDAINRLT